MDRDSKFKLKEIFANMRGELRDIEECVADSNGEHPFCCYYLQRNFVADADLIVCPYIYLVDSELRQKSPLENAIIIADEAHNAESAAKDGASLSLSRIHLKNL
jgi:Fanconi anemia group J protein